MGKKRRHRKGRVALGITAAVILAGILAWFHGPPVPAAPGPFISAGQAKALAEKVIAAHSSNPPSSGKGWNRHTRITYLQPEYDLAGNVVAYDCRVETESRPAGSVFVLTQGKGSVHVVSFEGKAHCDRKAQTAFGRDAKEGDHIVNAAQCGYDIAFKNKDGTYTVAQMGGGPKILSERSFLWAAWWDRSNPLRGYFSKSS